jgi:serine/threonine protein phosphatase PrpC
MRALRLNAQAAFAQVDGEVLKVRHWSYQGSTAVAVVVHPTEPGGRECSIITANVGDSRAVLCRRGKSVELTKVRSQHDRAFFTLLFVHQF